MTESEFQLEQSESVTIDDTGMATRTNIGPSKAGERWRITKTRVFATGRCTFAIYRGNEIIPDKQIEFTYSGQGDSSDTVIDLEPQEKVSIAFSGPVGTIGTVVFSGRTFVKGRRGN